MKKSLLLFFTISLMICSDLPAQDTLSNGKALNFPYILSDKNLRGLSITPGYLNSKRLIGVSIAGYAKINQSYGLSVALYNRAAELHGVQLGLLNFAGNNPKGLRVLPFLNLHF